jgi:5-methylcytosine-specific restriction endonuclease McrA
VTALFFPCEVGQNAVPASAQESAEVMPDPATLRSVADVLAVRSALPRFRAGDPRQAYRHQLAMRLRAIRSAAAGRIDHAYARRLFAEASNCPDCGEPMLGWNGRSPSLDHKVSLAKGGTNAPSNLRVICNRCNSRKADRA